jgi:hypothetical protein
LQRIRLGLTWLLLVAAGCGADTPQASLRLLTPTPDQVLTLADDADETRSGLQFNVTGAAREVDSGTTVFLFIDDEQRAQSAKIGNDGGIDFGAVTLPPGEHLIHLETGTGSSSSDKKQQYTFRALLIRSPEDGSRLTSKDDEDQSKDRLQIGVSVEAFALGGADVRLLLDDKGKGTATPDSQGIAAFPDLTLDAGPHRLKAQSGSGDDLVESPEVALEVDEGNCAELTFMSPAPPIASDSVTLGGPDLCASADAFEYTVRLATNAESGRSAKLFVNDLPAGDATVERSMIEFAGVQLPRKSDSANRLRVELQNEDGTSCSVAFPVDVYVDCEGPSCAITKPVPVAYVGADKQTTNFLNAAMRGEKQGFDVAVQTDASANPLVVSLLIDGVAGVVPNALAEGAGLATFDAAPLGDGEHAIEALCMDGAGNVTSSGEQTWTVDTSPCEIAISDPADDTRFVPADDEDGASAGTQVVLTTAVAGNDCVAQRSRVCDPALGIDTGEFLPFAGSSPLLSSARLDDGVSEQSLCVEVHDRAGNSALDSVKVSYLHAAPAVMIESPLDGDEYNMLGNAGFVEDADHDTPSACEARFAIACSELGADVELHQGAADGALIADGTCMEPGTGDPALPSGYAGWAFITAPFDDGDGTGTVVATQAITGTSTKTLIGSSTAVSLGGDCVAPLPALVGDPCEALGDGLLVVSPPATTAFTSDVTARTVDTDLTNLALAVSNTDGTSKLIDSPDPPLPGDHTWNAVSLGGIGEVTITATARDAFANVGQANCKAQITADPPALSAIAPANHAAFGPRDAYTDTCPTGTPGEYGIAWSAQLDQATDRKVSLYLDDELVLDDVPLSGTNASACIAVPDDGIHSPAGPSTLKARVATTQAGKAYVDYSRAVSVHSVELTDPTEGQVLQAGDDCLAGSAFGYMVHADVDVSLLDATFSLSGGSGTTVQGTVTGAEVTGCVRLGSGPRTISATVAGSPASDTVSIVVP